MTRFIESTSPTPVIETGPTVAAGGGDAAAGGAAGVLADGAGDGEAGEADGAPAGVGAGAVWACAWIAQHISAALAARGSQARGAVIVSFVPQTIV